MDKKLEARIARLERALSSKNEANIDPVASSVYKATDAIRDIVNDLCKTLAYDKINDYHAVGMALKLCKSEFSKDAYDRLDSIFEDRENGKEF